MSEIISTESTYIFTVDRDRHLTAIFEPIPVYTVTVLVDPSGGGTVTGAGSYKEGESVTVTAVAGNGMKFSKWTINNVEVSIEESHTFIVTEDLQITAIFVSASTLPDGYTEVEYIETTSGIRMPIGYTLNTSSDIIDSKWMMLESNTESGTGKNYIFQYRNGTYFAGVWAPTPTTVDTRFHSAAGGATTTTVSNLLNVMTNIKLDYKKKIVTVGTKNISMGSVASPTGVLYLFSSGGSTNIAKIGFLGRLYYCKISRNDVLTADLIPCVSPSGQAGLYDIVRGNFYSPDMRQDYLIAGPAV